MAVTPKVLVDRKFIENTQVTQYTSIKCTTVIDKFTVTNVSVTNVAVNVNLVQNGNVADTYNLVIKNKVIQPDETYSMIELVGQIIENGDFISTLCDTANSLVISVAGRQIT